MYDLQAKANFAPGLKKKNRQEEEIKIKKSKLYVNTCSLINFETLHLPAFCAIHVSLGTLAPLLTNTWRIQVFLFRQHFLFYQLKIPFHTYARSYLFSFAILIKLLCIIML